jgi:hypothetical protein
MRVFHKVLFQKFRFDFNLETEQPEAKKLEIVVLKIEFKIIVFEKTFLLKLIPKSS